MWLLKMIKAILEWLLGHLLYLLFGGTRYICLDLNKEAQQQPDRVVSHRIGPPIKNCPHIAMINGPDSATLQQIISGRDPKLRETFNVFANIFGIKNNPTSATFILDVENGLKKRKKIKDMISGKEKLNLLYTTSLEMISEEFKNWTTNQSVHKRLSHLVFKIFGNTVLGLDFVSENASEMFEEIEDRIIYHSEPILWGIPLTISQCKWLLTKWKYQRFIKATIAKNKQSILRGNNYIWTLMEEMAELKGGKPQDYIDCNEIAIGLSLFLAMGNLISLMAFSLYILMDEEIASHLYQEIQKDALHNDYVDQVYKELLRFISPANLLSRYTSIERLIGEKQIPKGSFLMICLKSILHDPAKWHQPEKFNPHRQFPQTFIYPFIPFSTGERMCPGVQATEVVFKAFLYILKDYKFLPNDNFSINQIPMHDPVIRLDPKYQARFVSRS